MHQNPLTSEEDTDTMDHHDAPATHHRPLRTAAGLYLPAAGEQPLEKTRDFIHYYHGYHEPGALCRVRVYETPEDQWHSPRTPVVLCSDQFTYNSTSITNLAEHVAAEIALKLFYHRLPRNRLAELAVHAARRIFGAGSRVPFYWIEHYPPGRWPLVEEEELLQLVSFGSYVPRGMDMSGLVRPRDMSERDWIPDPHDDDPEFGWEVVRPRAKRLALGDPHWIGLESREQLETWLGTGLDDAGYMPGHPHVLRPTQGGLS